VKELLIDVWGVVTAVLLAGYGIVHSVLSLVIIDNPFWRGVELTLIAVMIWHHRKALIAMVDRVPLLGGLTARLLRLVDDTADVAVELVVMSLKALKSKTWDKLAARVKKTDEDLRE